MICALAGGKSMCAPSSVWTSLKGLKRGHVRIALIEALGDGMLVRTVAEVEEEHPYLTFDLRVLENRLVGEQVSAAEVDFGLLLDPVEGPSLEIRAAATIPIGIAMPVDHPLAGRSRVSLGDALVYRQLLPAAPLIVHDLARTLYARHRADNGQSVACNNVRMMRSLIRSGVGIGILSLLDVASDVNEQRLAFVPLQGRQVRPPDPGALRSAAPAAVTRGAIGHSAADRRDARDRLSRRARDRSSHSVGLHQLFDRAPRDQ